MTMTVLVHAHSEFWLSSTCTLMLCHCPMAQWTVASSLCQPLERPCHPAFGGHSDLLVTSSLAYDHSIHTPLPCSRNRPLSPAHLPWRTDRNNPPCGRIGNAGIYRSVNDYQCTIQLPCIAGSLDTGSQPLIRRHCIRPLGKIQASNVLECLGSGALAACAWCNAV